jgi:capsular exopolysaccharide synthesis family protein
VARLPALPNWRRNVAAGFLFSVVLAGMVVILLDRLDDSVRTSNDLPRKPGFAALGMIPNSLLHLDEDVLYKIVDERSFSTIAEALRNLHIGLEVKYDNRRLGKTLVLTVTSALANEGKTMVSSNLALLFASLGRKTLLVDADLRKRSLSKTYGRFSPGLSEYLEGATFKPEDVMSLETPNLFLLPAGSVESNAPSTFKPEAFKILLAQMVANFEVVIFDTPPVLPMADACIMGHASDATVLVVRSRRTTLRQLDSALAKLEEAKVKEIQCIVNGVDEVDTYGYPSSQIYGYGLGERAAESTKQPRLTNGKTKPERR